MGLSVGLKNDRDQADALQPYFDFGIEEECWQNAECGAVQSWPAQYGKAVFDVEYGVDRGLRSARSPTRPQFNFNTIGKTDDLFDLPYRPCR